jgi:hypothetical protein
MTLNFGPRAYIIFNGPPKSGKDTVGNACHKLLMNEGVNCVKEKFAKPLKDAVAAFLSLTDEEREYFFENPKAKDTPSERFFGSTPRQMLISFSEDWAKKYGKDVFGKLMLERTKNLARDVVVITDCGFREELIPILTKTYSGFYLIRLKREGTSFEGDSRSYMQPIYDEESGLSLTYDVTNDKDAFEVAREVLELTRLLKKV